MQLESVITRESLDALYCVVHFGAADFRCGLVPYPGADAHAEIERGALREARAASRSRGCCARWTAHFPGRDYALRDLFLDERRRVAGVLLEGTMRRYEDDYLGIFDDNRRLMEFLREIDSPVPTPLRVAADVTLTRRILDVTGARARGEVRLAEAEDELLADGGARAPARRALRRRGGAPRGRGARARAASTRSSPATPASRARGRARRHPRSRPAGRAVARPLGARRTASGTGRAPPGITLDREKTAALARAALVRRARRSCERAGYAARRGEAQPALD